MWPIVMDGFAWSVCLLICYNLEPCKNNWTDLNAFWAVDSGWPKKLCVRWGTDPPIRRNNSEEGTLSAREMAGGKSNWNSKNNNSSTTEYELWGNAGPSAFQMQKTMLPSVLWCCWLGGRKGIRSVNIWVVRYWRGYLSGARYKWFAYGPADATATSSSLALVKSWMVYLSGAGLPRLSWKKGR